MNNNPFEKLCGRTEKLLKEIVREIIKENISANKMPLSELKKILPGTNTPTKRAELNNLIEMGFLILEDNAIKTHKKEKIVRLTQHFLRNFKEHRLGKIKELKKEIRELADSWDVALEDWGVMDYGKKGKK